MTEPWSDYSFYVGLLLGAAVTASGWAIYWLDSRRAARKVIPWRE